MPRFSRASTALLVLTPTVLLTGLPLLSAHTAAAAVYNPPAVGSATLTIMPSTLTPTYRRNLRPARTALAPGAVVSPSAELDSTVPVGCSRFDSPVGTWAGLFEDQFSGSSPDATKRTDHEPWETSGHRVSDAGYPAPSNDHQLQVGNGVLTFKARRVAGLPNGVTWTSAEATPRTRCPSRPALRPAPRRA